jgi:hypothetical protein
VEDASQTIKKSETASEIFLRSRETTFSPFLSWIALMITFRILLLLVSLVTLLRGVADVDIDTNEFILIVP